MFLNCFCIDMILSEWYLVSPSSSSTATSPLPGGSVLCHYPLSLTVALVSALCGRFCSLWDLRVATILTISGVRVLAATMTTATSRPFGILFTILLYNKNGVCIKCDVRIYHSM